MRRIVYDYGYALRDLIMIFEPLVSPLVTVLESRGKASQPRSCISTMNTLCDYLAHSRALRNWLLGKKAAHPRCRTLGRRSWRLYMGARVGSRSCLFP